MSDENNKILFYSTNWERTKVFTLSTLPLFDILVTPEFLCLIALPKSTTHDVGGVLLGVLGQSIAGSAEKKVASTIRSSWLDANQQLISHEYEKRTFLKIPTEDLKKSIILKKSFRQRLAFFNYNGKKIVLQKNKEEYERFKKYLELL